MNKNLVKLTEQIPLEKPKAQVVMDRFIQFFDEIAECEVKAKSIEIKDASQVKEMKEARDIRLNLKNIRVNAEKVKKSLKENILIEGRFIDGCYNLIAGTVKPIEDDLLEKEKYVERIEQARLEKIRVERFNLLAECEVDGTFFDLVNMPDAAFNILLETSRLNHKNKVKAEKQAEEERIAKEKAETERIGQMRIENEKLKKEAEEREKKEKVQQEKIKKEREKLEAERIKIEEEKREKERIEREKKEQEEKEARALEEKERQASLAPDKEKLILLANKIDSLELPELKSKDALIFLSSIKEQLTKTSNYIRENSRNI